VWFISHFVTISEPVFLWGPQQRAFNVLKQKIVELPALAFYSEEARTHVIKDMNAVGLGAVLLQ
jgi:hypothetical protein